jgi:hypothetical protein
MRTEASGFEAHLQKTPITYNFNEDEIIELSR